jgi:hypothetical protein
MEESFTYNFPFIVVAVIGLVAIGVTVLGVIGMWTWRKHQATKLEHDLKAEMVAAGMSAEEIERVLAAKADRK